MNPEQRTSRRQLLFALGGGVFAGSMAPVLAQTSAYRLRLEVRELRLPRWDAEGFRLGYLSDLHLNGEPHTDRAVQAVRRLIQTEPDLIALGGDYIEGRHPQIMARLERVLKACEEAACPVVAVMGNHDYWAKVPRRVVEIFANSKVKMLRNEMIDIDGVTVVGQDDAIERRTRFDFFPEARVSRSVIALLHEPDAVDEQPSHVSLQVSGHSHGGQLRLPLGVHVYTPKMARRFVDGFYAKAPVPLYVSRGVGTTGPDYRLFCDPEVTLLTLRSA